MNDYQQHLKDVAAEYAEEERKILSSWRAEDAAKLNADIKQYEILSRQKTVEEIADEIAAEREAEKMHTDGY